jgi:RNA polymerase sigma factor (sigma-70 family)
MAGEPFSPTEECELIRSAQRGDRAARDRLLRAFYSFAVKAARQHARRKGIDPDDAESEAGLAIIPAIGRFDPARGMRFSTYLAQRLRGTATEIARRERGGSTEHELVSAEHQDDKPAPSKFWSPKAIEWIRRLPRGNDRLIIKWLWFDVPPKSQAEIARRLRVSRSAVCQRRVVLMKRIWQKDQRAIFDQPLTTETLNKFSDFGYIFEEY